MQPKNPAALRQQLNLGKTPSFRLWYRKDVDAEIKHKEQYCQNRFENICEPIWGRKETNAWMIFWRSSGTLETLQPSMTTQSDIKQNWAELSHPRRTSQLHCLQYFRLTRIECRLLRPVLVLHHSQVLSHFPWQKCKKRCSKCDVAVVQTEMVWCWNCLNMALLVYMLVWWVFTMKYFAQDNLIYLGDTRCSQWFRKVGICNKPRTGGQ